MAKKKIKFAFTIQHGENRGLTSGSWRVWTNKEDTYVTAVTLGDMWKVSLHGDSAWRVAVTSEHMRSENPIWPKTQDRAPWKFEPTRFVDGHRLAFVIATTRGALIPGPISTDDVHIAVEDRWDVITMAQIWMTEPGVDIPSGVRLTGGPLALASGRRVWVIADIQEVPKAQESGAAVGNMIEPLLPTTHDVSAPGLILRGVNAV
ncbi:hypothetical protein [Streptomyces bauhiniae]|uniref:hypothetical protein n=1 Tax=Streptomyces bauhiniae TaxID=2340725 RepID=UPI00381E7F56